MILVLIYIIGVFISYLRLIAQEYTYSKKLFLMNIGLNPEYGLNGEMNNIIKDGYIFSIFVSLLSWFVLPSAFYEYFFIDNRYLFKFKNFNPKKWK